MRRLGKIWLINAIVFLILATPVSAITYGGVGGRPANPDPDVPNSEAWFIYGLGPGEIHEDGLVVQNATDEAVRVAVYPADSTPSSDGGFALKQKVEEMFGVGSWIKLYPEEPPATISSLYGGQEPESIPGRCAVLEDEQGASAEVKAYIEQLATWCLGQTEYEIDLEPGELTLVPFVISIPDEVDVGEHTGGLLVEKLAADAEGSSGLRLTTRVGVRVYETVPGDIVRAVTLSDFAVSGKNDSGNYVAAFSLTNNGNVSIDGQATLYVEPSFLGESVEPISREVQVLRGDTLTTNFEWPASSAGGSAADRVERPSPGTYMVRAEFSFHDGEQTQVISSESAKVSLIPWTTIILVLALLVILIVLLILIARHRRKMYDTSGWAKYKVQIGENLEDIAERAGVDWKQLALANKLPKPYTLKDGESLMVPPNAKSRRKAPVAKSNSKKESTNETQGPSSSRRQIVMARTIIAVLVGVVVIILVIITLPQEPGPRAEIYDPTPIELTEEAVQEQMEELFGDREVAQEEVMEEIALPKPEDILVQILNGSGTAGEAGKLADRLRVGGYIIDHIGNADRFDYQEMLVYYPDGNEEKAIVVEEYLIELGYNVTVDERNDLGDLVTVIIGQGQ